MRAESGVVIVGASVAGVRVAQALRRENIAGPVTLVDGDKFATYDKPPLSKSFLAGLDLPENGSLPTAEALRDLGIAVLLGGAACRVDTDARLVQTAAGATLSYEKLVIATGARARPSPWGGSDRIQTVRSLEDAVKVRGWIASGASLAIIGAGMIGCEIAAIALEQGCAIDLIDPAPLPMARVLPPSVAQRMAGIHLQRGVNLLLGVGVSDLVPSSSGVRVNLSDGRTVDADAVIVAIGSMPNTEWCASSRGLTVDDGVICDMYGRAHGVDGVFALGDVARWQDSPQGAPRSRREHWTSAVEQASVVAHNISYPDNMRTWRDEGYAWSDQYDVKLQIIGSSPDPSSWYSIVSPKEEGRICNVHVREDEAIDAAVTLNWPRAAAVTRKMLSDGSARLPDLEQLLVAEAVAVLSEDL